MVYACLMHGTYFGMLHAACCITRCIACIGVYVATYQSGTEVLKKWDIGSKSGGGGGGGSHSLTFKVNMEINYWPALCECKCG